jgi:hypothetical protein
MARGLAGFPAAAGGCVIRNADATNPSGMSSSSANHGIGGDDFIVNHSNEGMNNGSSDAKDNFRFERVIMDWRGGSVLDLRRRG